MVDIEERLETADHHIDQVQALLQESADEIEAAVSDNVVLESL